MQNNFCEICKKSSLLPALDGFQKCGNCGAVYNLNYKTAEYSDSYFIDDYLKQYGHTYEEDFPNIYKASQKRLRNIIKISNSDFGKNNSSALDIGCAMGFFLKACKDAGFSKIEGIEISKYASSKAEELFKFQIHNGEFSKYSSQKKFNLVTAWYFFEHEENPIEAITKASQLLQENGILAFSIPSVFGPLYQKHYKDWIKTHPIDHRIDFTPKSLSILLNNLGFCKIKIKPSGLHPERYFPSKLSKNTILKNLYKLYSNLFSYSDTLEIYAVKKAQ